MLSKFRQYVAMLNAFWPYWAMLWHGGPCCVMLGHNITSTMGGISRVAAWFAKLWSRLRLSLKPIKMKRKQFPNGIGKVSQGIGKLIALSSSNWYEPLGTHGAPICARCCTELGRVGKTKKVSRIFPLNQISRGFQGHTDRWKVMLYRSSNFHKFVTTNALNLLLPSMRHHVITNVVSIRAIWRLLAGGDIRLL